MSVSGGVSIARNRGENRFYNPPHVRQRQQQQQRQQVQQQQEEEKQRRPSTCSSSVESDKRAGSDECASLSSSTTTTKSDCSVSGLGSGLGASDVTNLDRFLEHTTPAVPAQYFPKVRFGYTEKRIGI